MFIQSHSNSFYRQVSTNQLSHFRLLTSIFNKEIHPISLQKNQVQLVSFVCKRKRGTPYWNTPHAIMQVVSS